MGGRLPAKVTVVEMMALILKAVEVAKPENTSLYYQRWCTEFTMGVRPASPSVAPTRARSRCPWPRASG
jgi:hypothetical protein